MIREAALVLLFGFSALAAGCGDVAKFETPDAAISTQIDADVDIDAAIVCNTRFAIIRRDTGPFDIFTVDEDGSNLTNLTNSADFNDIAPRWSSDGSKISFLSNQTGSDGINIMNADGTGVQFVVDGVSPRMSPDGEKVLFTRSEIAGSDIFVINADGTNEAQLTELGGSAPFWTPDGSQIVFESLRGGDSEVFLMNANGSAQTNLTANTVPDVDPSISSDGQRIVYVTQSMRHLAVINIDGTEGQSFFEGGDFESDPSFSPDGTKLVFKSGLNIMVSNIDGSDAITVGQGNKPRWSPRGDQIAYEDDVSSGVAVADATTANSGQLITTEGGSSTVEWQPCLP